MDIASDKQASDILLLDIRPASLIADYFVICSSLSDRQTTAIVRDIEESVRDDLGERPLRIEGQAASGWVLIDYGDVIVHVFSPDKRHFYQLEELWEGATPVLRMQ
ncbi:MAG: ribosome silencing factor [Chloroflexota bacterium]